MDPAIQAALGRSQLIDLTTTGRRSGEPRRIEIFLHNIDGRLLISGKPFAGHVRAWLRNVEANPALTLHLKQGVVADVPGTGRVVTEPEERRRLIEAMARAWGRTDIEAMMADSPLIEVTVPGFATAASAPAA